ncbi:Versatile peroxidase VPL1 [Colletotrichum sp. SAR 10_70]|nr:Versatile peroxidase VPL1 [Colletotrichum sp. SAR 10_70]KAI8198085.1 Versatile peroxidase VPL1 [Colletotrichum sp. SAR 10_76]
MRVSILTAALVATPVLGYPGMKNTFAEIAARQGSSSGGKSTEIIGDLATLDDSKLTPVGNNIKQLLSGAGNAESDEAYPSGKKRSAPIHPRDYAKDTPACAADTCCIWKYIADDLATTFRGESGRCTDFARAAIRLGFHDAAGWSKGTGNLGGADGSIVLSSSEASRVENKGLEEIIEQTKTWYNKYKQYGISMADLIQFSANAATVVCPLGPRVRTFIGRKDSSVAAPPNLLPDVNSPADALIDLFNNKTISSYGLISLIGAHTTSQQRFVDPSRSGDPQDSTPGVWDVKFYSETIGNAPPRVFKFNSDVALSKYPSTSAQFAAFAGPGGQAAWNSAYAHEYVRLSLLGVYNINDLTECTKSLPARWAPSGFTASDQGNVDTWVASKGPVPNIPDEIRGGKPIGPPPRPSGPGASGNSPAPPTPKGGAPGGQYGNGPSSPPKGNAPTAPNGNGPAVPPKGNAPGGQYGGGGAPPKDNSPPAGNGPSAPPKGNSPGGQYGGGGGGGGGAPPKGNSSPPSTGGGGGGGYGY